MYLIGLSLITGERFSSQVLVVDRGCRSRDRGCCFSRATGSGQWWI